MSPKVARDNLDLRGLAEQPARLVEAPSAVPVISRQPLAAGPGQGTSRQGRDLGLGRRKVRPPKAPHGWGKPSHAGPVRPAHSAGTVTVIDASLAFQAR